jgi:hypothetical protein
MDASQLFLTRERALNWHGLHKLCPLIVTIPGLTHFPTFPGPPEVAHGRRSLSFKRHPSQQRGESKPFLHLFLLREKTKGKKKNTLKLGCVDGDYYYDRVYYPV